MGTNTGGGCSRGGPRAPTSGSSRRHPSRPPTPTPAPVPLPAVQGPRPPARGRPPRGAAAAWVPPPSPSGPGRHPSVSHPGAWGPDRRPHTPNSRPREDGGVAVPGQQPAQTRPVPEVSSSPLVTREGERGQRGGPQQGRRRPGPDGSPGTRVPVRAFPVRGEDSPVCPPVLA